MPRLRLRNQRIDSATQANESDLANVLRLTAWLQYNQLEDVPSPRSPLVGLLQLLSWVDLHHLACTERAHRQFHQVRSLLEYGRRQTDIDAVWGFPNRHGYTHCHVCLVERGRFRAHCARCGASLLCRKCVCMVNRASLGDFPFPQFHRRGSTRWSPPKPLRQGDVLCLDCYPSAATHEQLRNRRLASYFYAIMDGMMGYGEWSPLNTRWGGLTFSMLLEHGHRMNVLQIVPHERQTESVVPGQAVSIHHRATVQL